MKKSLIAASLTVIALAQLVPGPADKVVFLDIGQGDSILIERGTAQFLVDGGAGMKVLERLGEEMPWFDKKLDVIILTHPQQDHVEGLLHVLERYQVGLVVFPQAAYGSQLNQEWLKKIRDWHIPYRFAWAGEKLSVADLQLQILAPFPDAEDQRLIARNINDASTTTRIDFAGLSFLLSGDAEKPAEHYLVTHTPKAFLDIDVLKAGHHGSKTSTTQELLNATTPQMVVISVGAKNKFGHPSAEVLQRLTALPVWRTDQNGSVKFEHTGEQWLLKTGK